MAMFLKKDKEETGDSRSVDKDKKRYRWPSHEELEDDKYWRSVSSNEFDQERLYSSGF